MAFSSWNIIVPLGPSYIFLVYALLSVFCRYGNFLVILGPFEEFSLRFVPHVHIIDVFLKFPLLSWIFLVYDLLFDFSRIGNFLVSLGPLWRFLS